MFSYYFFYTSSEGGEVWEVWKIPNIFFYNMTASLRNVEGRFLTDSLSWAELSLTMEQVFTPELHGEYQAFRSQTGFYIGLTDDGSLEMSSSSTVNDAQLFKGLRGEQFLL